MIKYKPIFNIKKFFLIFFLIILISLKIIYLQKSKITIMKLKSIPVYLPEEKLMALKTISKSKRQARTRLIEQELDKMFKREGYQFK